MKKYGYKFVEVKKHAGLAGIIASMLIRHANDGKMYLYDVLDIKKETSNPFKS